MSRGVSTKTLITRQVHCEVHRVVVCVDPVDWIDVISGLKTEVRMYQGPPPSGWKRRELPHPCVLYMPNELTGEPSTALGMILAQWHEPLGAISPESLEREGFKDDYDGFRRYFGLRYPRGGYRPLASVFVRHVRPMTEDDAEEWRDKIWDKLYGDLA